MGLPTGEALISEFHVDELFNRYNYHLIFPPEALHDRVAILYGDNGAGKTTVLRLMWHLLSPSNNKGHRSALRHIPFRQLRLRYSDGTELRADKARHLPGSLSISIHSPNGEVLTSEWDAERPPIVDDWDTQAIVDSLDDFPDEIRRAGEIVLGQRQYIEYLQILSANPYYLADDRKIYSDSLEDPSDAEDLRERFVRRRPPGPQETQGAVAQELAISISRSERLLRDMALGGTTTGSASANSVYLEVLDGLGHAPPESSSTQSDIVSRLSLHIEALGERNIRFQELGLVPEFPSGQLLKTLRELPATRVAIAEEVLAPYLSSTEARLDALHPAQSIIRTFLDEVNSFLIDKSLTFSPTDGLRIRLDEGKITLSPAQLSSGEKQLILLLSNTLLARQGTRLFLVDEPELSLNVKWQRKVVPALLACTAGAPVQFIIATHSVEVLSGFRQSVVSLSSE